MNKPFLHQSWTGGVGSFAQDKNGVKYVVLSVRQTLDYRTRYRPVRTMQNIATGEIKRVTQDSYLLDFYPVGGEQ